MTAPDLVEEMQRRGTAEIKARMNRPKEAREPKAKKRGHPERDAQRAVVAWLRKAGCIVQATFTEQQAASKDPALRARFGAARKASGATTGFPDLTVVLPDGRIVFIEMKAEKGRLSDAQTYIHADLRGRGAIVILGRDIWSVQDALAAQGVVVERKPRFALAAPVESLRG